MAATPDAGCLAQLDPQQQETRHLLHVFASFGYGGVPIRICEVINGLGGHFRHTVIALDGCFDAGRRLAPDAAVRFRPLSLPKYNVLRSLAQVRDAVREAAPDLVLTYNWGAIEAALAIRLLGSCDHIHFESGFGVEEGEGQLWRRNLFRRLALARVRKVVVPSATLMQIATSAWSVPPAKLLQIPNGVDLRRYCGEAGCRDPLPGVAADPEAIVIGTVAPLRPEKNVARLLRAFARLPEHPRCVLVVAGDGVELEGLRRLAAGLGIAERTVFLGHVENVPAVLRGLDIFALSSDTEQMPNSLLQAMAAARPVAAVDVGDVACIVAPENRALVVQRGEEAALAGALAALAGDARRRRRLGRLNQERAKAKYSLAAMVRAYGALLGAV